MTLAADTPFAEVRAAIEAAEVIPLGKNEARVAWSVTLELAGSARPALVARWPVQMRY